MRLESQRETVFDFEVDEYLIGVELLAEGPERRPLDARARIRAEIAVQDQPPVARGHAQFIVKRIEQLDAVGRAFGKWNAVPRVFVRAILPRHGLPGPAGDFHLGASRAQAL